MGNKRGNVRGKVTVSEETVVLGGRAAACRVFTWSRPGAPRLKVRFVAPRTDDPHRQLILPEPLMKFWAAHEPANGVGATARATAERALSAFFDKVFDEGYRILQAFQPGGEGVPAPAEFRMMKALFRNRSKGAIAVNRKLRSASEMVRRSTSGCYTLPCEDGDEDSGGGSRSPGVPLEVTVPGLEADPTASRGRTWKQITTQALASALAAEGVELKKGVPFSAAVKHHTQRVSFRGQSLFQANAEDLYLLRRPCAFDNFTTVGLVRSTPWNQAAAINSVGGGLLAGDVSLIADIRRYGNSPYAAQLRVKFVETAKKPAGAFDKWLETVRETGFVRLLGSCFPDAPRNAELRAALRADYRVLMWEAHLLMARCYGAWAWRAWLDFRLHNTGGTPSPVESWLFQQQNFPNIAFAGLPLGFLSTGQLPWVQGLLRVAWAEGAWAWERFNSLAERLDSGEPVADLPVPSAPGELRGLDGTLYDACTQALGVYKITAEEDRVADRAEKQRRRAVKARGPKAEAAEKPRVHSSCAGDGADAGDSTQTLAPDDAEVFDPECLTCNECGRMFDLVERGRTKSGFPAALLSCRCETRWRRLKVPARGGYEPRAGQDASR